MKKYILIFAALLFTQFSLLGDNYGMTSFPVLMMENMGARMLSLADSGVALKDDVNAMSVNPAGIAGIKRIVFTAMRLGWMFDTSFYSVAVVYPLSKKGSSGVLGLTGILFDINNFDTVVDGNTTGSNVGGDLLLGLTYANNFFNFFSPKAAKKIHLDVGVSAKYAQSKLATYSASVLSIDVGLNLSFRVPSLGIKTGEDNFTFGISMKNISFILSKYTETSEVIAPSYFNVGFYYMFVRDKRHGVALTTALKKPSDNDMMLAAGLEYTYRGIIYLRGGYKLLGRDHEGFTFGFGLNFEVSDSLAFQVDYTNIDLQDFGKSDIFSLSILF